MKLISLDINGFKSFPEPTHIQFHSGITAIVGPNGSGKSNISDALLWVLGEQSVKSLRGSKMQDLIFSGTQHRKAHAFAEVMLTLDNSDHELNVAYDTIEIKRRLYRTGESEYAINQHTCRLKDIVDLFLDSGLGKNGYSLVGQGRIDEILSARYEDRRLIFDEAAGISKFRKRKEEAEQKLRYTEDNLVRIQDIQREISTQLQTLAKQAELAQTYLNLQAELTDLDLARIYFELHAYTDKMAKLKADSAILQDEIATQETAKTELLTANENLQAKRNAMQADIEELQTKTESLTWKISELKQQLELLNLNRSKYKQERLEKEQAIVDIETELNSLGEKVKLDEQAKASLNEELLVLEAELSKWQTEFGASLEVSSKAETKWQQAQTQLNKEQASYWQDKSKLADLQAKQAAVKSKLAVQKTTVEDLAKQLSKFTKEEANLTEQVNKATAKENVAKKDLEQALGAYNACKVEVQKLAKVVSDNEAALNSLTYRQHGLTLAANNYEGFNQSVRQLLTYVRKKLLYSQEQVIGSLADLITVPNEYVHAIDSVLGQSIQNIVTDTAKTAAELITLLKEKHFGRANFLPLDNLRSRSINDNDLRNLERLSGFIGIASNLVNCKSAYKAAIDFRLGRIIVVDNLTTAREAAQLCDRRYLIVTLEGDQISVGGAMSGGEKQRNTASLLLLERRQEISKLDAEIKASQQTLEAKQAEFKQAEQALGEKELLIAKLKQVNENCHMDLLAKQQELKQQTLQKENLAKKEAFERQALSQAQAEYAKNYANLPDAIREQEQTFASLQARELALQAEREELNKQSQLSNDKQAELHKCELALTEKKSALKLKTELLANLQAQVQNLQGKLANTRSLLAMLIKDQANLGTDESKWQTDLQKLENDLAKTKELSKVKNEELNQLEQANSGSFQKLNDLHALLSKLNNQLTRLQNQVDREEQTRRELLQELWENYQKSLQDVPDKLEKDYQPKRDLAMIRDLRAEIKALGPVNVEAIEQYNDLQERYDFIEQQRSDIIASKKELDQLIVQITEAMQEKFSASFALIQANFQDIFVKLFGGGQGEICLEEKADILSANIEIKACPPGKRMQNMLLLSGGERCLTAIALLFAIQSLKPSAFCVLDEVEAALDDANIFRFTEYLKKQAGKTQFIVVTHRKSTMAACERIYGVTMQERGVSQVLTLALAEDQAKFSKMIE